MIGFNKIIDIGINPSLSSKQRTHIGLLNRLSLIVFVASVVTLLIGILRDYVKYEQFAFLILISVSVWYFHYKERYEVVKIMLGFFFPLVVGYVMITSDSNYAFTNVFLLCALFAFVFFEDQSMLKFASLSFIALIASVSLLYIYLYKPAYHIDLNPYNDFVIFAGVLVALYFFLEVYQKELSDAHLEKQKLVSALVEKNQELERFAYVTSHDLKEPVRNIESLSKFIKKSLKDEKYNDRNKKMVGLIKDSSIRMSTLIDSILKYSKLESKDLPFEKIDLNDIIREFLTTHSSLINNKEVVFEYENLPNVKGNRTFLYLLFQNLIENGFKYNQSKVKKVSIFSKIESGYHQIVIRDNGIGINEEFKDYIFEPFKRLHNNDSFKGSGLGLSICKKIVDIHGGKVWVSSNPDGGSSFNFSLPALEASF